TPLEFFYDSFANDRGITNTNINALARYFVTGGTRSTPGKAWWAHQRTGVMNHALGLHYQPSLGCDESRPYEWISSTRTMLLKSSDLSLAYAYLMVLPARGATTFGCIAGTFYNVFGCGIMPIPNVQFYIR